MLETTNKCLQKQKSQNLSKNILAKTDYAERKKNVAKYFSGRKGVRVWMGMDGRGSGVDTNIISNQASHPPSHFIGLQQRKEIMKAFMRRHHLKEMVVVP